jgi:hypothetical protein
MYKNVTIYSISAICRIGFVLAIAAATLVAPPAVAAVDGEARIAAYGMTAKTTLTLSTPCAPYTLDWGDGEIDKQEPNEDMMCIQVIQELTMQHTYSEAGTYDIILSYGGDTERHTVTVPVKTDTFDLDDVQSVTSLWVDPNEMVADEEYTIYTVILKDGSTVEINAGGFTTEEWRTQQFVDAGYAGDIAALTALAEPEETPSEPKEDEPSLRIKMQQQVIELLNQIISLLHLR